MSSVLCLLICACTSVLPQPAFVTAQPVWPEGRETEKNLFAGFRAVFDAPGGDAAVLRVTASTIYRAFVNGAFAGHGPARAAHGYFRVDEWDIARFLRPGSNVVVIEVAGYNANSYYLLDQPSFLQAEVAGNGRVVAATGVAENPFIATVLDERVQKVQRFSFQRPFIEVYRLAPGFDAWRNDPAASRKSAPLAVLATRNLLPRGVPSPRFDVLTPAAHTATGTMTAKDRGTDVWKDRSLVEIGPKLGGYPEQELELVVSTEMQAYETGTMKAVDAPYAAAPALPLEAMQFHTLDFGRNVTGFARCTVACESPTRLFILFDEMLLNNDVDFKRLGTVSVLSYELAPGQYSLEAFEPYTLRYAKFFVPEGQCRISEIGLRTYENPEAARAVFACSDPRLDRIFEAARATFAQNAPDIFMDCPSRERAGWLCDSYFTAEAALDLCGNTSVERNFLENYALPERFAHLPEGMLPMCYPSDHNDGVFIPNWALWCVVQLGAYWDRGGDRATIERMRPKVLALFDYFAKFKNEDGLLEKLESWVFVEWSKANEFVQHVNYPSNMLYAGALDTAARLYGLSDLANEAAAIRKTIREQAYDGTFFVDNAVREDGKLTRTGNKSEVCQYFAFFFGVASPETHAELWQVLRDEFGPARKDTKAHADVYSANMFVGNILRLELLSKFGAQRRMVDELCGYFGHMAESSGTLWENDGAYASLNHGFASHAAVSLYRDVLGVHIDLVNKTVSVSFPDIGVAWSEGRVPVGDGFVALRWERDGAKIRYRLAIPDGFTADVPEADTIVRVE